MGNQYFTDETVVFLKELSDNNNREWFNSNKDRYLFHVKQASENFVAQLKQEFANMGLPYIADIKKSLFRIYRDVRFSKNKEPYKTHVGVYFPYKPAFDRQIDSVGLYLHISGFENSNADDGSDCGWEKYPSFISCGVHMPEPAVWKAIRNKWSEDYNEFIKISENRSFRAAFPDMFENEALKRPPAGFDKDDPAIELIKCKEYSVYNSVINKELVNIDQIEYVAGKAAIAVPFLEFFNEAIA